MEGKWYVDSGYSQYHSTFLEGKRHCTLASNCFGVIVNANNGKIRTCNFPVWLKQGGDWYTHKKERISGNSFDQECF